MTICSPFPVLVDSMYQDFVGNFRACIHGEHRPQCLVMPSCGLGLRVTVASRTTWRVSAHLRRLEDSGRICVGSPLRFGTNYQ